MRSVSCIGARAGRRQYKKVRPCQMNRAVARHSSVIIHNLDFLRPRVRPSKNNPPLIIDANRMKSREIAPQRFEPIARRGGKITKHSRAVYLDKLAACDKVRRESRRRLPRNQDRLGEFPLKTPDHARRRSTMA